jgi:hypothetical protein
MLAGRSSIARVQRIPVVALHRAGTRIDDLLPFATKRHGKRDGRAAVGRRYKAGTARIETMVDSPGTRSSGSAAG